MIAARPIGLAATIATVSPGCTPPFSTPTSNDVGRMSARNKTYLRHANETAATAAACASAAGFVAEVEVLEGSPAQRILEPAAAARRRPDRRRLP